MKDTLFDLPDDKPSELAAARLKFDEAKLAYDQAAEREDDFGDPVPRDIASNYRNAQRDLSIAEQNEYNRRKR